MKEKKNIALFKGQAKAFLHNILELMLDYPSSYVSINTKKTWPLNLSIQKIQMLHLCDSQSFKNILFAQDEKESLTTQLCFLQGRAYLKMDDIDIYFRGDFSLKKRIKNSKTREFNQFVTQERLESKNIYKNYVNNIEIHTSLSVASSSLVSELFESLNFFSNEHTQKVNTFISPAELIFYQHSYSPFWTEKLGRVSDHTVNQASQCKSKEITVPSHQKHLFHLNELLLKRRSKRHHAPDKKIDVSLATQFLSLCAGDLPSKKGPKVYRRYPSGGNTNELDIYFFISSKGHNIKEYYYNPRENKLHMEKKFSKEISLYILKSISKFWNVDSYPMSFGIITSNLPLRSINYQGNLLGNSMISAGCLLQNMALVATALDLSFCPIGKIAYPLQELFPIIQGKLPISCFCLGHPEHNDV